MDDEGTRTQATVGVVVLWHLLVQMSIVLGGLCAGPKAPMAWLVEHTSVCVLMVGAGL